MSKMSYCPLDEAWSLCKPLDNNLNLNPENTKLDIGGYQLENPRSTPLSDKQMSENKIESDFAAFIRDKSDVEEQSKTKMKELVLSNKKDLCQLFLKHVEGCDSCRNKMTEKFGNKMMERFQNIQNIKRTNYFEILMIILVGIIIIVIMDSFVRLGKMMKK